MNRATCLAVALAAGPGVATQADTVWEDDFDSYEPGTVLHDVGGWRAWDGNPAWAATVTDDVAHSGTNSMSMAPDTDMVQQFEGVDCGVYELSIWTYVRDIHSGISWFNLLGQYSEGGPTDLTLAIVVEANNGWVLGWSGMDQPIAYGEWRELNWVIDLGANEVTVRYGGEIIYDGKWAHATDFVPLVALDLFNWFEDEGTYADTIRLTRLFPPGDVDLDGAVGFTDLLALLAAWGDCPDEPDPCRADVDCDGYVGFQDLLTLLAAWTP